MITNSLVAPSFCSQVSKKNLLSLFTAAIQSFFSVFILPGNATYRSNRKNITATDLEWAGYILSAS